MIRKLGLVKADGMYARTGYKEQHSNPKRRYANKDHSATDGFGTRKAHDLLGFEDRNETDGGALGDDADQQQQPVGHEHRGSRSFVALAQELAGDVSHRTQHTL